MTLGRPPRRGRKVGHLSASLPWGRGRREEGLNRDQQREGLARSPGGEPESEFRASSSRASRSQGPKAGSPSEDLRPRAWKVLKGRPQQERGPRLEAGRRLRASRFRGWAPPRGGPQASLWVDPRASRRGPLSLIRPPAGIARASKRPPRGDLETRERGPHREEGCSRTIVPPGLGASVGWT